MVDILLSPPKKAGRFFNNNRRSRTGPFHCEADLLASLACLNCVPIKIERLERRLGLGMMQVIRLTAWQSFSVRANSASHCLRSGGYSLVSGMLHALQNGGTHYPKESLQSWTI